MFGSLCRPSGALVEFGIAYPQLALWATDIPPAARVLPLRWANAPTEGSLPRSY